MYLVDKLTPLTPKEACRAFASHLPLDPHVLACHVAQSALETDHWKSLHWHNMGNVKATSKWTGDTTCFGCNEVIKNKKGKKVVVWFHPGPEVEWPSRKAWLKKHPTSKVNTAACTWRAFTTPEAGVAQQLAFLKTRPRSWAAAKTGDPAAFAKALKADRYYTADVEHYTSLLKTLFTMYYKRCVAAVEHERERRAQVEVEPPSPEPANVEDHEAPRQVVTNEHLELLPLELDWDEMDEAKRREVAGYDDGLTSD